MQDTDQLINQLTDDLEPVKIIKSPYIRTAIFLSICLLHLFAFSVILDFRYDFVEKLENKFYLAEIILVFIGSIITALFAFYLNVPDNYNKHKFKYIALIPTILLSAFLTLKFFYPQLLSEGPTDHTLTTFQCFFDVIVFSIFPIMVAFFTLRKGATIMPYWSSLLISLSAVNFSYITMRFIEPNDSARHLLLWHYTPMIIIVLLSLLFGRRFLKW